jgi:2,3-bisphosphoglycerate-dependent phosphoglycerate mutase
MNEGILNAYLVIVRHGQSVYNLKNLFTGWIDCSLSEKGEEEAREAGKIILAHHLAFDVVYCSELKRSWETYDLIASEDHQLFDHLPVFKRQALNERHYGDLQGKNKEETAKEYGQEQVHIWRRSYDVRPPGGESLEDTAIRVNKLYESEIKPLLINGKRILIVAHGNSLRALIMYLENIPPEKIETVEIVTGQVILYRFNINNAVAEKKVLSS